MRQTAFMKIYVHCTVNKNPLKNPTKTMRTSVVKFDDLSLTLKEQSGQSTWMCLFN